MKWAVMLLATKVLCGKLEPLDDPPPHLPRYQNLTKAHAIHSDAGSNEDIELSIISEIRRNDLLPVSNTDKKLTFEDTLLAGVYDQFFIPVDQLSNAISLADDEDNEGWNTTMKLAINAPWLRAALHSDNFRFADAFDRMNDKMISVYSSSFALIGQMIAGLENVYVGSNSTGPPPFHNTEPFGQTCEFRNDHALKLSRMVDRNIRSTASFARVDYLKQQAQLRREFEEQRRHFQIVQKQLKQWDHQNDTAISLSLRARIRNFDSGTERLIRQMNVTLTTSFMMAQAEVQSAAQAFLLHSRPLSTAISQFRPESWKECYTNFYAMNNLVKDTIIPAVEAFNIKLIASMMGLRASIYEAAVAHYPQLERQLAIFSTITSVPYFDD